MPTKDDDKKAKDNNAKRQLKNERRDQNRQRGERQFSKKTDHL
ncbi:DUF3941 domain-containing protein [Bacillus marinisedimentorum]|nr:DUF3941 domain-containing protein [Bacillus marinisedimentorum]